MTVSVSKKVYEQVLQVIEDLQKKSPYKPVTQKQVCGKFQLNDRHVRRAFRKLREDGRIIRYAHGQYWLPASLERNIEYLKRRIEFEKGFWQDVDNLRLQKIAELEQRLKDMELHYEDEKERARIVKRI